MKKSWTAAWMAAAAAALLAGTCAQAQEPIKLGAIYLMSGGAAVYGEFAQQGAKLAIDEINASGGVLGRPLQIKFEDGQGKAATAIQAARKLVYQDEVAALMGIDSSGVAQGLVPVMPELKTPLMITHAATPAVTGKLCNKYTFRVSSYVAQMVTGGAQIAAKTDAKNWTTIGPDYAFGHEAWEYFSKALKEFNPDVHLMEDKLAFPAFGAEDYTPFIDSVMQSKPDGVLISLWGGDLVNFVRQASQRGFFEQGYTVMANVGAAVEVLTALGDKMPEGLWLGTRYWYGSWDNPINKHFVESYVKNFKHPPSYNAEGAYVAVYAYKQAMETANSTAADKIVEVLPGMSMEAPTGKLVFRAGDHQALVGPTWGKSGPMDSVYKIRTLTQIQNFDGAEVTPPVDPQCQL